MVIDWQNPEALYLILPALGTGLAFALIARSRRRAAAAAFVSGEMAPRLMPPDSPERFWIKTLLWNAGLLFALLAVARPQFGQYFEEVKVRGADLYVIMDVSKSMLAEDVKPSRLKRAQADVDGLLNHLRGERVGLIAFAGRASVICPLTADHAFFRTALNDLGPYSVDRGGTAIGDAIRKALQVLPQDSDRDQALLLITDGDDQNSYPMDAAQMAAERRVIIFTVGLGDSDAGAQIPLKSANGTSFVEHDGKRVVSKLQENLLEEIALKTNGVYVPARTRAYDLGQLYDEHLSRLRGETAQEKRRVRLSEQYQVFLGLSLICFILDLLIQPYTRRTAYTSDAPPVSRSYKKSGKQKQPMMPPTPVVQFGAPPSIPAAQKTGPAALILFLCLLGLINHSSSIVIAAEPVNPPSPALGADPNAEKKDPAKSGDEKSKDSKDGKDGKDDKAGDAEAPKEKPFEKGNPDQLNREGLAFYEASDLVKAGDKFYSAEKSLDEHAQIRRMAQASFNQGCVSYKTGDHKNAKDQFLRANTAQDKNLAADALYNLGLNAADEAKALCGDDAEKVPAEKRQEILDKLVESVRAFRNAQQLRPDDVNIRRNIEMIRLWMIFYKGRWEELDRIKRREETDLLQFLEFLIAAETQIREDVKPMTSTSSRDKLAELKRTQDLLLEEVQPLNVKINQQFDKMIQEAQKKHEEQANAAANQTNPPPKPPLVNPPAATPAPEDFEKTKKMYEDARKMFLDWAEAAGNKMRSASGNLASRNPKGVYKDLRVTLDNFENLWESGAPFEALLHRDVRDTKKVSSELAPEEPEEDAKTEKSKDAKLPDDPLKAPVINKPDSAPSKPAKQDLGFIKPKKKDATKDEIVTKPDSGAKSTQPAPKVEVKKENPTPSNPQKVEPKPSVPPVSTQPPPKVKV